MNFRELFTKLDELADVQVKSNDPVANKMSQVNKTTMNTAMGQDGPIPSKDIPGTQPQLGPKPVTVAPAVPQGYKQPTPQVVADPKSDVDAMAAALKAVMAQQKMTQPVGLQTPPTSAEKTKIGSEPNTPAGKPGEPLEEAPKKRYNSPSGLPKDMMDATRRMRSDYVRDLWIADINKDPTAYDRIDNPREKAAVKAWLERNGSQDLIDKINAAAPQASNADAPRTSGNDKAQAQPQTAGGKDDKAQAQPQTAGGKDDKAQAQPQTAGGKDDKAQAQPQTAGGKDDKAQAQPQTAGGKDDRNGSDVQSDAATASKTKRQYAPGTLYQGLGSKDKPNEQVRAMQKQLIALGYDLGDGRDDGRFGPDTKRAVMQFQTDNKLKVDGVAGIATLPALNRVYKEKVPPQGDNTNTNLPGSADANAGNTNANAGNTNANAGNTNANAGNTNSNAGNTNANAGNTKTDMSIATAPNASTARLNANKVDGPTTNSLGVVAQPGASVSGPANANNPPAAAPATTDTKPLTRSMSDVDAARERQAQAAKDAELVRQADIIKKYGSLDPTKTQVRTGNVNKPWYELKTGDIDYDKDGRKIVYTKNALGGPGQWSAGSWKDHTANPFSKETPGIFFGPSYDSEEGKKFVQAYRDRTLNPDEYEVLKKHWEQNPRVTNNATVSTSAREVPVDNRDPNVANALDTRGRNTATTPESKGWNPALMVDVNGQRVWDPTNISKALKEELHSELTSIAEELINKKI